MCPKGSGLQAVGAWVLLWEDVDKAVAWGLIFLLLWKIQSVKLSAVWPSRNCYGLLILGLFLFPGKALNLPALFSHPCFLFTPHLFFISSDLRLLPVLIFSLIIPISLSHLRLSFWVWTGYYIIWWWCVKLSWVLKPEEKNPTVSVSAFGSLAISCHCGHQQAHCVCAVKRKLQNLATRSKSGKHVQGQSFPRKSKKSQ